MIIALSTLLTASQCSIYVSWCFDHRACISLGGRIGTGTGCAGRQGPEKTVYCEEHKLNPSFFTRRHPAHLLIVSVQILPPEKIQAPLWPRDLDTSILLEVHCNAVSRVDNAMTGHRIGYGRYDIQVLQMLAIWMHWHRRKRKGQINK